MDKLALMGAHPCPLEVEREWQPGEMLFAHCYDKMMPLIRDAVKRGIVVITTARPEADVKASFAKLGWAIREADECLANYAEVVSLAAVVVQYDAGAADQKVLDAKALDPDPAATAAAFARVAADEQAAAAADPDKKP